MNLKSENLCIIQAELEGVLSNFKVHAKKFTVFVIFTPVVFFFYQYLHQFNLIFNGV
jgi:hypothetical protein